MNYFFTQTHNDTNTQSKKAFTLLEVMIALFVFSASLAVLLSLTSKGFSASKTSSATLVAHYLAVEGLETVEQVRYNNFLEFGYLVGTNWLSNIDCLQDCQISSLSSQSMFEPTLTACSVVGVSCGKLKATFSNVGDFIGFLPNPSGPYTRKVTITPITNFPNEAQIVSKVSWNQAGESKTIVVEKVITNWFQKDINIPQIP
jgi:prepilin-type N-terminal cleavage/methylation domain-containing protein